MTMKKKVSLVLELLDQHYPHDSKCFLDYKEPHELLVATILSAQCTDDRVNLITKELFKRYTDVSDFAQANTKELEEMIHSVGFYHNKAKNIIMCCQMLLEKHKGVVPSDIDDLTNLPGVGRKTANVVRGHIFNIPSITVDTHVKRVSNKLGFTTNSDPVKIEFDLYEILPKDHWIRYNQQIITLGRRICHARSPKCCECFLSEYCAAFINSTVKPSKQG